MKQVITNGTCPCAKCGDEIGINGSFQLDKSGWWDPYIEGYKSERGGGAYVHFTCLSDKRANEVSENIAKEISDKK